MVAEAALRLGLVVSPLRGILLQADLRAVCLVQAVTLRIIRNRVVLMHRTLLSRNLRCMRWNNYTLLILFLSCVVAKFCTSSVTQSASHLAAIAWLNVLVVPARHLTHPDVMFCHSVKFKQA